MASEPRVRRRRETTQTPALAYFAEASGGRPRRPSMIHILYVFMMLNRSISQNEANSSESSGFPGLSADFFATTLILLVDPERRPAAPRPRLGRG